MVQKKPIVFDYVFFLIMYDHITVFNSVLCISHNIYIIK